MVCQNANTQLALSQTADIMAGRAATAELHHPFSHTGLSCRKAADHLSHLCERCNLLKQAQSLYANTADHTHDQAILGWACPTCQRSAMQGFGSSQMSFTTKSMPGCCAACCVALTMAMQQCHSAFLRILQTSNPHQGNNVCGLLSLFCGVRCAKAEVLAACIPAD